MIFFIFLFVMLCWYELFYVKLPEKKEQKKMEEDARKRIKQEAVIRRVQRPRDSVQKRKSQMKFIRDDGDINYELLTSCLYGEDQCLKKEAHDFLDRLKQ